MRVHLRPSLAMRLLRENLDREIEERMLDLELVKRFACFDARPVRIENHHSSTGVVKPNGHFYLTRKQREVIRLLCAGGTSQTIGRRMGVKQPAVNNLLTRCQRALGVSGRVDLVRMAIKAGLDS